VAWILIESAGPPKVLDIPKTYEIRLYTYGSALLSLANLSLFDRWRLESYLVAFMAVQNQENKALAMSNGLSDWQKLSGFDIRLRHSSCRRIIIAVCRQRVINTTEEWQATALNGLQLLVRLLFNSVVVLALKWNAGSRFVNGRSLIKGQAGLMLIDIFAFLF